jgi:hypothetical protein
LLQILAGAKKVILAGKKLVLHARPGSNAAAPNDYDTTLLTLARELAKETCVLLLILPAIF